MKNNCNWRSVIAHILQQSNKINDDLLTFRDKITIDLNNQSNLLQKSFTSIVV